MKTLKFIVAFLLLAPIGFAQTTHDRIHGRGASTFDELSNTAVVVITGATPAVSGGNIFKTNNGGVTAVTNFLGGVDSQQITVICGDANTTISNNSNIVTASGSNFTCGVNQSIAFIFDAGQAKWVQSGSVSGGGGGGSPGAPANALQKNDGSSHFIASSLADNGTTVTIGNEAQFCGINPYLDIRCYGARAVTSVPSTTATISSGSATATLAASAGLQNGDGVTIYGAGATNPLAAPGAVTVTPIVAKGLIGTGEVVASVAGATAYNYQYIKRDKPGALTAASSVGSTSTGQAVLGAIPVSITSITRANNVVTVNLSSSTPLVPTAAVWIAGNTDPTFNGAFQVSTTPSSTQFTFLSGTDTRSGGATSTSGGTVNYYVGNRLTWTMGSEWQDYIYGRTGGTLTRIGFSKPEEGIFDDWGATIMGSPSFPSYVPTNPPVAATNRPLTTTIVSGGGTTTPTFANTASNSVSGATLKMDAAPAILAAHSAGGITPILIPSTPSGSFVVNSYLPLNFALNIEQAGLLVLNETFELGSGTNWLGVPGTESSFGAIGAWSQYSFVSCVASPCVYENGAGGQTRIERLLLDNENDQAVLWLVDGSSGFQHSYSWMHFVTGNGGLNEDYLGIGFEARGGTKYDFYKASFYPHMNNSGPMGLWSPAVHLRGGDSIGCPTCPAGALAMYETYMGPKGVNIDATAAFSSVNVDVNGYYTNGSRMPLFTATQNFGGTLANLWSIKKTTTDTSSAPLVANLSTSLSNLYLENVGGASSGGVNVSGNPIASLIVNGSGGPIGPNTGLTAGPSFSNNFVNVNNQGYFGTLLPTPAAVASLVASAGGGVPTGTVHYVIAAVDINNQTTVTGADATITVSGGTQTVTGTPPVLPSGSIGYIVYRGTNGIDYGQVNANGSCNTVTAGVTFVDNGVLCGNSHPTTSAAAQSSLGAQGVATPTFRLMTNGFTTTVVGDSTASQSVTYPHASGTVCVTGACAVNSVTVGGDSSFSASPRSMPPVFFPGALTTTWTGASWTLDKAITVTRVQSAAKVAPAGCGTSAIVRLSDGSSNVNLTVNAATNDSGAISQNYAAGATLTVSVQTAAAGCTTAPGDLNVSIQSRTQ